jgi:hypothetical protein
MTPRELKQHKKAPKIISAVPVFKPLKRKKLPKPFDRMGGPRVVSTGLIKVSDDHAAIFFCRDGPLLSDTAFIAYLMCTLASGSLSPIFEFHWHPSHKGVHCKTPCKTQFNYTDRMLPGAPEFALKTNTKLDPREAGGRLKLIHAFCKSCGITLERESQLGQLNLDSRWK